MTTSYAPKTLDELFTALAALPPKGKILGGGTDLIVQMELGNVTPEALLYLGDLPELRRMELRDDSLVIGAAVTMQELADSPLLGEEFAAIAHAACDIGSPQIRNKAMLAGNVANASPAGDLPPVLFLLGAQVEIACPNGTVKLLPIQEVLLGPGKLGIAQNEAIIRFVLPRRKEAAYRSAFTKLGFRGRVTVSRIGACTSVTRDADGLVTDAVLYIGAISLTPVHLEDAERVMLGRRLDDELAREVGELLSARIFQITPEKFDRDYKVSASRGVIEDLFHLFR